MGQQDAVSPNSASTERIQPTLHLFKGFLSPGIAFESGHTIWLFKFDETPIPPGAYSAVWIESPAGDLTMYTDPATAGEYTKAYHDPDLIVGASIEWLSADLTHIDVVLEADDGSALALSARLAQSSKTRLMELLAGSVPRVVQQSRIGAMASSFMLTQLLGANGLQLRGTTETGTRYWGEADHLRTIGDASATLDGADLGQQIPGTSTHDFGDVKTARDPYVVFGVLNLKYPAPRQPL